jgi:hypothetical protein
MSDIVTRLRQTRANMIGTDDEQHYFDCHDAAAEIERLRAIMASQTDSPQAVERTPEPASTPGEGTRQVACTLTDAERFVLREVMDIYAREDDVASNEIAAVIDGLLERTK